MSAGGLSLLSAWARVFASDDPRPEFAATAINQVLLFYFGTSDAADDASIDIIVPLVSEHGDLVPFKIIAPGAEKIAVVTDANPEPLILAIDQIRHSPGVIVGRARFAQSGTLTCYVMRSGVLGRASRRVAVPGHWQEQS